MGSEEGKPGVYLRDCMERDNMPPEKQFCMKGKENESYFEKAEFCDPFETTIECLTGSLLAQRQGLTCGSNQQTGLPSTKDAEESAQGECGA